MIERKLGQLFLSLLRIWIFHEESFVPGVSILLWASQVALVVKNTLTNARDTGLIPGLGRYSGEGNGNSLQYSCLEKPVHRGAWRAIVHGVRKSRMRLRTSSKSKSHLTGSFWKLSERELFHDGLFSLFHKHSDVHEHLHSRPNMCCYRV